MGVTNLKVGLSRKYASWSGEQQKLTREVARIEEQIKNLEEKRERIQRINWLKAATLIVMKELDPDWDPAKVKPSIPQNQTLPFPHGEATRTTFSIMRELARPTNPKELAKLALERLGEDPTDPDLLKRMTANIDATFRKQLGKNVRIVSKRPTYWEIIEEIDDGS